MHALLAQQPCLWQNSLLKVDFPIVQWLWDLKKWKEDRCHLMYVVCVPLLLIFIANDINLVYSMNA